MSGQRVPPVPDDNSARNPKPTRQRRRRKIKLPRRATGKRPLSQRPMVIVAILVFAALWFAAFIYVLNSVARPGPG